MPLGMLRAGTRTTGNHDFLILEIISNFDTSRRTPPKPKKARENGSGSRQGLVDFKVAEVVKTFVVSKKAEKTNESFDDFRYNRPRMVAFSEKCRNFCSFSGQAVV